MLLRGSFINFETGRGGGGLGCTYTLEVKVYSERKRRYKEIWALPPIGVLGQSSSLPKMCGL